MSGLWIKLHDVHVRADAQTSSQIEALDVLRRLAEMYNVPSVIEQCDCEWDCYCEWIPRDHGD